MVKQTFLLALSAFFLSLFSAVFLLAGEFTASVSSTELHLSESFTLNLTLKGISPKEAPAVAVLKEHFLVQSQQHSANTTVVNGKVTSNITWKLSLIPKGEGVVQIPSIAIDTAEGLLSTQPITLHVTKGAAPQSNDDIGLNIITKVSNASPYKNEPLTYTAFLTSKTPLYNVQTQKMQIDDAIVELVEEPKLEEQVIGGALLHVVKFTYLITPLKTGPVIIPPITIQGAVPQKTKRQFAFFNDDLDPFALMHGFDRLKPFALMADEIQLDVQPAVPDLSPWLPAKTLTIEEVWPSDQILRVGEPFSRSFVVRAEGLKSSQLPHLADLQGQSATFKVYSDKPVEQEKIHQGSIHSMRKEQYTLIPQQAGTWTLPEISISWWDSPNKQKRISTIPARTIQILPALEPATSSPQEVASMATAVPSTELQPAVASVRPNSLLYAIIAILTFLLAAALLWAFTLQRKINSLTKAPVQNRVKPRMIRPKSTVVQKQKKEKLPDLNPT